MTQYNVGDIRNGYPVLPKEERPKILFIGDDLRLLSGIATMTKEIVLGTCHRYNFICLSSAINHPEHGKMLDVSADIIAQTGVPDVEVKLLAWNSYGDSGILRQLLTVEQPAALIHFTDPRYFTWLYEMEHEVRQNCPIIYWELWDGGSGIADVGDADPHYNAPYYASCDSLLAISKQSYGINQRVLSKAYPDEFELKLSK